MQKKWVSINKSTLYRWNFLIDRWWKLINSGGKSLNSPTKNVVINLEDQKIPQIALRDFD
jgi:hypothetical protein